MESKSTRGTIDVTCAIGGATKSTIATFSIVNA
jgi:hypothetical protein